MIHEGTDMTAEGASAEVATKALIDGTLKLYDNLH